jgi:hypothetical protein
MECPYCGAELELHDYFGRLASHQDGKVLGNIYICPIGEEGGDCDSALFHVAGSFYAYRDTSDILHDGYPC